jgi:hypothetical protein
MIEYFGRGLTSDDAGSLLGDIKLLQREGSQNRYVAAHMNNVDEHFDVILAAFMLGMEENQFLGTGVVWE